MNEKPPYLADVQVGDKLYNFLESNKKYRVKNINLEDSNNSLYPIQVVAEDKFTINISRHGTKYFSEKVPYFLYAPVDVLDPKNLPPRPWKPKKGEWVWCRCSADKAWNLRRFIDKEGDEYLLEKADGTGAIFYMEIAPFKGELPPGLEVNDESD